MYYDARRPAPQATSFALGHLMPDACKTPCRVPCLIFPRPCMRTLWQRRFLWANCLNSLRAQPVTQRHRFSPCIYARLWMLVVDTWQVPMPAQSDYIRAGKSLLCSCLYLYLYLVPLLPSQRTSSLTGWGSGMHGLVPELQLRQKAGNAHTLARWGMRRAHMPTQYPAYRPSS